MLDINFSAWIKVSAFIQSEQSQGLFSKIRNPLILGPHRVCCTCPVGSGSSRANHAKFLVLTDLGKSTESVSFVWVPTTQDSGLVCSVLLALHSNSLAISVYHYPCQKNVLSTINLFILDNKNFYLYIKFHGNQPNLLILFHFWLQNEHLINWYGKSHKLT